MSAFDEWQSMETAPRNRPILVIGTAHNMLMPDPQMLVAEWRGGWWGMNHTISHITHWRELPGLPAQRSSK
jgi:hypothetical protein